MKRSRDSELSAMLKSVGLVGRVANHRGEAKVVFIM
jgi:hypothetical protein